VLTVTPATLTYLANAASRAFGAPNPVFTGTVTGFVNGDTQASATIGTLSFSSTATATSAAGSYAITGSGLSAGNYVFTQAAGNATALTVATNQSNIPLPPAATMVLIGFTTSLQQPPRVPPPLLQAGLFEIPVPPPPPPQSPLADNNSEQPTSSDQTTNQVAGSLDGGGGSAARGANGRVVIPRMLVNARPPAPPPTDISALSSFGNPRSGSKYFAGQPAASARSCCAASRARLADERR
jgi:hypothetical protein